MVCWAYDRFNNCNNEILEGLNANLLEKMFDLQGTYMELVNEEGILMLIAGPWFVHGQD